MIELVAVGASAMVVGWLYGRWSRPGESADERMTRHEPAHDIKCQKEYASPWKCAPDCDVRAWKKKRSGLES